VKRVGKKLLRAVDVKGGILNGLWSVIRMHQAREAKTDFLSGGKWKKWQGLE
jgi:hypothetical protein